MPTSDTENGSLDVKTGTTDTKNGTTDTKIGTFYTGIGTNRIRKLLKLNGNALNHIKKRCFCAGRDTISTSYLPLTEYDKSAKALLQLLNISSGI
jgi:hypothetical protein